MSTLTEELSRRGHEVTLFAVGDSRTSARLHPTIDQALWHSDTPMRNLDPFWAITLDSIWHHVDEFDVVHSHLDCWGFPLARQSAVPVVTTLHGRLDLPELQPLFRHFSDVPLVSISDAQRQPVAWANFVNTVYHGIPLEEFTFNPKPKEYLAFLGRISPEKGLDSAIHTASRAGWPIRVAARKPLRHADDPSTRADWKHYNEDIKPLLQKTDVKFVGEVGGAEKDAFLRNAAALLFPIRWPEPFGLVMVEALACGTPVIALRAGSVSEVIEDGVTGFICANEDELVDAVKRIGEIDRQRCRAEAERRFSPSAMASAYERVYERLMRTPGRQREGGEAERLTRTYDRAGR